MNETNGMRDLGGILDGIVEFINHWKELHDEEQVKTVSREARIRELEELLRHRQGSSDAVVLRKSISEKDRVIAKLKAENNELQRVVSNEQRKYSEKCHAESEDQYNQRREILRLEQMLNEKQEKVVELENKLRISAIRYQTLGQSCSELQNQLAVKNIEIEKMKEFVMKCKDHVNKVVSSMNNDKQRLKDMWQKLHVAKKDGFELPSEQEKSNLVELGKPNNSQNPDGKITSNVSSGRKGRTGVVGMKKEAERNGGLLSICSEWTKKIALQQQETTHGSVQRSQSRSGFGFNDTFNDAFVPETPLVRLKSNPDVSKGGTFISPRPLSDLARDRLAAKRKSDCTNGGNNDNRKRAKNAAASNSTNAFIVPRINTNFNRQKASSVEPTAEGIGLSNPLRSSQVVYSDMIKARKGAGGTEKNCQQPNGMGGDKFKSVPKAVDNLLPPPLPTTDNERSTCSDAVNKVNNSIKNDKLLPSVMAAKRKLFKPNKKLTKPFSQLSNMSSVDPF